MVGCRHEGVHDRGGRQAAAPALVQLERAGSARSVPTPPHSSSPPLRSTAPLLQEASPSHIAPWARAELVFANEFDEFDDYISKNADRLVKELPKEVRGGVGAGALRPRIGRAVWCRAALHPPLLSCTAAASPALHFVCLTSRHSQPSPSRMHPCTHAPPSHTRILPPHHRRLRRRSWTSWTRRCSCCARTTTTQRRRAPRSSRRTRTCWRTTWRACCQVRGRLGLGLLLQEWCVLAAAWCRRRGALWPPEPASQRTGARPKRWSTHRYINAGATLDSLATTYASEIYDDDFDDAVLDDVKSGSASGDEDAGGAE